MKRLTPEQIKIAAAIQRNEAMIRDLKLTNQALASLLPFQGSRHAVTRIYDPIRGGDVPIGRPGPTVRPEAPDIIPTNGAGAGGSAPTCRKAPAPPTSERNQI